MDRVPARSVVAGLQQRPVGIPDEVVDGVVVVGAEGRADARVDRDRLDAEVELGREEVHQEAGHLLGHLGVLDLLEDDDELGALVLQGVGVG